MEYTEIDRITFCGEEEYHTIYNIDVEEKIYRSGITASIIMRTYASGNMRFYIPENYAPPFKTFGKYLIASDGDEVVCDGKIEKVSSGSVKDVDVMRFKVEG